MGIECNEGIAIIEQEDVSDLLKVLNAIPGIKIRRDDLESLLKKEQINMCESLCVTESCFAKRNCGLTSMGILTSVEDMIIKDSGVNN